MKKPRRKKFIPEFKPQYVSVIVERKGSYYCVQIKEIHYSSKGIEVIGRI